MKIKETPVVPHESDRLFPKVLAAIGVALLAATAASAQTTPGPQPSICSRACWGARSSSCSTSLGSLTRAIIHHTADPNDFNTTSLESSKARVRYHQSYHMDGNGWCDIGYHFLVDKLGNIFEGRVGSLGGSSGWKRGNHAGCGNNNSMGFNFMGYYHTPC